MKQLTRRQRLLRAHVRWVGRKIGFRTVIAVGWHHAEGTVALKVRCPCGDVQVMVPYKARIHRQCQACAAEPRMGLTNAQAEERLALLELAISSRG